MANAFQIDLDVASFFSTRGMKKALMVSGREGLAVTMIRIWISKT